MSDGEFLTEERTYRKKPVVVTAYQTDREFDIETLEGTMTASVGDFIITGVAGEQYPCKPDIFFETYDVEDNSISDEVMVNLSEWSSLVTELSEKEIKLYQSKEAYIALSDTLLEQAKKDKEEGKGDIIKDLYGYNNDKTRSRYVKDELKDEDKDIKDLEFSIDYLKRRISYLKSLIHTKTVILEIKE